MTACKRLFPALALALLLAACSSKPPWVKPGTSNDTASDDLAECRELANAAVKRDSAIDQDILATRGVDWQRNSTLQAKKTTFTLQDEGHARDIIADCMSAKGYAPRGSGQG
jgi:outer membrane PBP1 activator LpoA protein